jgi:gamma-glutamyltranspeptidase/glutathione hydrolase
VHHVRSRGGILSEADFAEYQPQIVEPLRVNYRGYELFTSPPPAGGITTFQILRTLEQFDIKAMDPSGGEYFHTLAESIKLCWRDRARSLGDPDYVKIPIDELFSVESAKAKAAEIRSGRVAAAPDSVRDASPHTVNISAIDREGNVASIHATHGFLFGSTIVVPGMGLVLNHGMSRFDFAPPGNPNSPAPRKRMHHNMAPVIALKDGKPVFACGLPGGAKIIPVTARLITNAIDFGLSPGHSITLPRIHVETDEPVHVSPNLAPTVVADLEARGHKTKLDEKIGGATNVISIAREPGQITAADSLGRECVAVF